MTDDATTNETQGVSSGRIADVEILRALAVSFVVFHHADGNLLNNGQLLGGFVHQYFGGWVGVDLFFVISGFVIARTLLPVLESSRNALEYRENTYRFWGRRAFRLLPSAWLWLGIILVLQIFFNESGVFGGLRENLWATLAGIFNFANFRFADAFMSYPYGVSFVYWSLSLEEQFYLLLPLLFFVSRRYLPVVLLLIIAWQLPRVHGLLAMSVRSAAICFGVLIALASQNQLYRRLDPRNNKVLRRIYSALVVGALVLLPLIGGFNQQQIPLQIGIIATLSALIVFCCSFDSDLLAAIPASPVLIWLGARSYAIYLIHIPAFFAVRELAYRTGLSPQEHSHAVVIATLFMILILAELNYRLIESPARRLSRRLFK